MRNSDRVLVLIEWATFAAIIGLVAAVIIILGGCTCDTPVYQPKCGVAVALADGAPDGGRADGG